MSFLGIDSDNGEVYEGNTYGGTAKLPVPVIYPAEFISSSENVLSPNSGVNLSEAEYVFCEISYDPISRSRRGRFYKKNASTQPMEWHVSPHPMKPSEFKQVNEHGVLRKRLLTFSGFTVQSTLREMAAGQPLVTLGASTAFTIWSVVSIEQVGFAHEIVILRARQSFGALPNIYHENIPEFGVDKINEVIRLLSEDIFRAGPNSVIDRCRDAVCVMISVWLQEKGLTKKGKDLGALIRVLNDNKEKRIVANSADNIRLLHARGKSSEQEMREVRALTEQDAELSVQSVGIILCELGWGGWY